MEARTELEKQIEAAFDYRGHVTLHLKDGGRVEGYLYNREFARPLLQEPPFVELFLKDKDERRKIPLDALLRVELTGKDFAETYEAGLKRTGQKKPGS